MKTFIEKDPIVRELLKEKQILSKKENILQRKLVKKVEKLLSTRVPVAISSQKWIVSDDFYSDHSPEDFKYSLFFKIYDEEKDNVCSPISLPGLNGHNLRSKKAKAAKLSSYKKSMMIPLSRINPEIKTWRDLSRVCEHWDIHLIKWNDVFISIGERSFRIISNDGLDGVFSAAKELGITLNMRSSISEIEALELYLEKKKKLMSDLSSKMLFSV